jgi:hypothetical protein
MSNMSNKKRHQGKSHHHDKPQIKNHVATVEHAKATIGALSDNLKLANGLAAFATVAGVALATSAAVFEAPLIMGIAVAMAGIAAAAAVKKLRTIEPFLRHEQEESQISSMGSHHEQSKDGRTLVIR